MDSTTLNSAKQKIYSVDLQPVIDRLVKVEHWHENEAKEAVAQYRNYLLLRKKYPEKNLPPSKDIDEAWHAHVLHTEDYRKFCKEVFDNEEDAYLDHHPHIAKEETLERLSSYYEDTQQLYFKEFGEYIYQITGTTVLEKLKNKLRNWLLNKFPHLQNHQNNSTHASELSGV